MTLPMQGTVCNPNASSPGELVYKFEVTSFTILEIL